MDYIDKEKVEQILKKADKHGNYTEETCLALNYVYEQIQTLPGVDVVIPEFKMGDTVYALRKNLAIDAKKNESMVQWFTIERIQFQPVYEIWYGPLVGCKVEDDLFATEKEAKQALGGKYVSSIY